MKDRIAVLHLRSSVAAGGGPEKTIYNTGRFINHQRFLYLVVYLTKKSQPSEIAQKGKDEGLTYFQLPGVKFFDVRQFREIMRIIRTYRVQILHCHDPKTDFYGVLLKVFFPNLKLISTLHGWIHRTWESNLYKRIDIWTLKRFNSVIAVSKTIERIAESYGIKRVSLIYNAIDIDEWRPKYHCTNLFTLHDPQAFLVGYVGRISTEKGPIDFVKVAYKVLQNDSHCEFIVAGEGPEMEAMKNLALKLDIITHFHFLGHVKSEDLYSIYQKLDLLLVTSITEGLPNNILEAFAMYVPVVATRIGGISEIVDDGYNGLLATPGDVSELANLVLKIKNNKELSDSFKNRGRLIIEEKFSFDVRVKKIEELYITISQK
jgi:glycosyltransferase involved in cell wall biosynthesis